MTNTEHVPNPVIRSERLVAYPGWTLREYADGMYDAFYTGGALSPGFDSRADAGSWLADLEPAPLLTDLDIAVLNAARKILYGITDRHATTPNEARVITTAEFAEQSVFHVLTKASAFLKIPMTHAQLHEDGRPS